MEKLLNEEIINQVKDFLNEMENPVNALIFKGKNEESELTEQLIKEIAEINDKITVETFESGSEKASIYSLDSSLYPALVILADGKDMGVKFYGVPSGHEFSTLLTDFVSLSKNGKTDFSEDTVSKISSVDKKTRIRVFVTPTCPYCPKAVISGHQAAMINSNISGEMVEANEFGELSMKHGVSSVPHTVIEVLENDTWVTKNEFVGAYPENNFVDELLKALN